MLFEIRLKVKKEIEAKDDEEALDKFGQWFEESTYADIGLVIEKKVVQLICIKFVIMKDFIFTIRAENKEECKKELIEIIEENNIEELFRNYFFEKDSN